MLWVTRHRPHFDRCASIWLIKTFIDKEAVFEFVSREAEIPEGAMGFVLSKAELNPSETETTFDLLMKKYSIEDPIVKIIASFLHDYEIDADEDFDRVKHNETAGFFSIIKGLDRTSKSDSEIVYKAMIVMDALYAQVKAREEGDEDD